LFSARAVGSTARLLRVAIAKPAMAMVAARYLPSFLSIAESPLRFVNRAQAGSKDAGYVLLQGSSHGSHFGRACTKYRKNEQEKKMGDARSLRGYAVWLVK
jgi:hypothetical protein